MGMFVTFTQANTTSTIEFSYEGNSLSRYNGPESFLTTYESKPLGKNKVLGTLNVKNQLGVAVTASVAIIPNNSSNLAIEIGSVTTYDYKIGSGSWVTVSYADPDYMVTDIDVSLSAGETKTLYVIFEKTNLAVDYYLSSIVIRARARNCPFQTSQVPFSTCQLCVEAWKTEVALLREQAKNMRSSEKSPKKLSMPVLETSGSTFMNNKLKEIDELLKNDDIDPLEYIQLRRQHVNNLIRGEPTEPEADNEEPETVTPQPRKIRIAVISKSLIGNKISTAPVGWELPKEISGKVIDTIFDLAKTKHTEDIRLRAGDYKIACIAVEKNKVALIIIDADEEFETYDSVSTRIYEKLKKEKKWEDLVKKMQGISTS